ncbi:hypothetical protein T484DRAFT_1828670, partial [Baffinella frigidus]
MPIWDVNHELACKAPTGPLEDAKCNVEDVEIANTQQLSALLNDMANTTYFRLFQINLEGQCKWKQRPGKQWKRKGQKRRRRRTALLTSPEIANTQQRSALLTDMANTTYFRLFQINLGTPGRSPTAQAAAKAGGGQSKPPDGLFGFGIPTTNQ